MPTEYATSHFSDVGGLLIKLSVLVLQKKAGRRATAKRPAKGAYRDAWEGAHAEADLAAAPGDRHGLDPRQAALLTNGARRQKRAYKSRPLRGDLHRRSD